MATAESDPAQNPEDKQEKAEPSSDQKSTESASSPADQPGSAGGEAAGAGAGPPVDLHQHHISKILDEVLEEPAEAPTPGRIKHPMLLDIVLAISLLVAMGGFTIGLFKMYLTHSAEQSITQHNFKAAIAILKGAPLPGLFAIPGSDPDELLNQALYLDAMDKIENENDLNGGLNELQQIKPGSRYFSLAQEIINENYTPSPTMLKMGVEQTEKNPPKEEKQPFNPEYPKDATP